MMDMGGPFAGPISPQQQPEFDPSKLNPMALQYAQMFYPDMGLEQAIPLLYGNRNPQQPGVMPYSQRAMVDNGMFAGGVM